MMNYTFIRELLYCFVEQSSRVSCPSVLLCSCYSDNVPLVLFMVVVNYLTITVDGCRARIRGYCNWHHYNRRIAVKCTTGKLCNSSIV